MKEDAAKAFKMIGQAYEMLVDVKKRQQYEFMIRTERPEIAENWRKQTGEVTLSRLTIFQQRAQIKKYIDEIRLDAKNQIDPSKKDVLNMLASSIEHATHVFLSRSSKVKDKVAAVMNLNTAINKVDEMGGDFVHVDKTKYSAKKILATVFTFGIYALFNSLKEAEKTSAKSGKNMTQEVKETLDTSAGSVIKKRLS